MRPAGQEFVPEKRLRRSADQGGPVETVENRSRLRTENKGTGGRVPARRGERVPLGGELHQTLVVK